MAGHNPTLKSCYALVDRAESHIRSLARRTSRLMKGGSYGVTSYIDPATMPPPGQLSVSKEIVLVGRVRRRPQWITWGIVVGEAINDLRCALDHAVWSLSGARTVPPKPVPFGSPWRRVGWPVVTREADWPRVSGSRLLFLDEAAQGAIRMFQPFARREADPDRDEFAVLDELWNVHKHRQIAVTEFWVGLEAVASRLNSVQVFDAPGGFADGLRRSLTDHGYEIVSQRPRGPFKNGVELGRVRETGPEYSVFAEFDVHATLAVEVVFEGGAPAYDGAGVLDTLAELRDAVRSALDALISTCSTRQALAQP